MSDAQLRSLERRFKATGRIEDEAAWLRERIRIDDVDADRVRLARYLGHPAARNVVVGWEPVAGASALVKTDWRLFGTPVLERAMIIAHRRVVTHRASTRGEESGLATLAQCRFEAALVEWAQHPHVSELEAVTRWNPRPVPHQYFDDATPSNDPGFRHYSAWFAWTYAEWRAGEPFPNQSCPIGAFRAELVPWLLGYGDPVQRRLADFLAATDTQPNDSE